MGLGALLLAFVVRSDSEVGAVQRLGRAECRLVMSAAEISLSGRLDVALIIEGPAPVEVEVPRPLVDAPDWRVRAGPARTEELPDGRQRWKQTFRLEPFQTGAVTLALGPLRFRTGNEVRDRELTWPPRTVRVTSSAPDSDLSAARSVTDIEHLPPVGPPSRIPWFVGIGALILAAAGGLVAWRLLRKGARPQAPLSPVERALAELRALETSGPSPEQLPRVADVLRRFLEERFRLAATRQTTAEFQATLRAAGVLSAARAEDVADVLARCDLVKFAGARPDRAACESLLRRARALVTECGAAGQTISPA